MNCRVCARPNASKYNHYGANFICGSCKGFFMRATQSDLYKTFIHGHNCVIDSKNRSSCKMCRFNKCLEVGMKINYVKTLEEKCKKLVKSSQNIEQFKSSSTAFEEKEALEAIYDANYE